MISGSRVKARDDKKFAWDDKRFVRNDKKFARDDKEIVTVFGNAFFAIGSLLYLFIIYNVILHKTEQVVQ